MTESRRKWMIYGANGFTGRMIARRAAKEGLKPILAGRNASAVEAFAAGLGLEWRAFDLSDGSTLQGNLEDCRLVLHCAGPFNETSSPMADAAIRSGCHYLDITGEIAVYQELHSRGGAAERAGVMLLPGVGFDVVPTDCLAARLKRELPDAHHLSLAFVGPNKAAAGSIKTALHQLPHGSQVREAGTLRTIPHFSRKRTIEIEGKSHTVYSIPWGDVFTAFHSTGIPNISVYTEFPKGQEIGLKWMMPLAALLKRPGVMRAAERAVEMLAPNPDEDYLATARFSIWGEVRNPHGETRLAIIDTPDTYSFTAASAVRCARKVIQGAAIPGFQTPSLVFGPEFVFEVGGTIKIDYFGETLKHRRET